MTRLVRDRLTWLLYAQIAVYGYFLYGFSPSIPLLRAEQHVSRGVSGLHGTALAVGAVLAGLSGPVVVRAFGRRAVLWGGLGGACAGLLVYTSSTMLWVTLLGAVVTGTCGSLTLNVSSAALSDHHGDVGPTALTEANAGAAAAGVVAPIVVAAGVSVGVGWRPAMLLMIPMALAAALVFGRLAVPSGPTPGARDTVLPDESGPHRRLPRRFWIAWVVLILCVGTEFCTTIWCSDVLHTRDHLAPGTAAIGVTAVVSGMLLGRALGSRLALRHPPDYVIVRTVGVLLVGFAVFWLTTDGLVAMLGLVLVGAGIGPQYPMGLARLFAASDGQPVRAVSLSALGVGTAVGIGPFALGAVADHIGTHGAFLGVPMLAALVWVGIVVGRRSDARTAALA